MAEEDSRPDPDGSVASLVPNPTAPPRRNRGIARAMAAVGAVGLAAVAFAAGRISEHRSQAATPPGSVAAASGGWFMYQPNAAPIHSPAASGSSIEADEEPGWFETFEMAGTLLGQRTTGGVQLTAYRVPLPADGWWSMWSADDFPDFRPPDWCVPTDDVRVAAVADGGATVGIGTIMWTRGVRDGVELAPLVVGILEGRPRFGVIAQADDSIGSVAIDASGGRHDEADVVDGLAMVLVDGAVDADATVTVTHTDGSTTTSQPGHSSAADAYALDDDACSPPPPALPTAGEQPADADAARAAVTAAVTAVIMGADGWRDAVADSSGTGRWTDDPADTTDAVDSSDGRAADIREVVFTSPTQAWVRFRSSEYDGGQDSFAVADLVDGRWLLSHDSACGILSDTDGWCDSEYGPVLPPSAEDDPRYGFGDDGTTAYADGDGTQQTDEVVVVPVTDAG